MSTLTPHRDNTEIAIARFVAHVDSQEPKDASEAVERRLTKILVSELLRASADFDDLLTPPDAAQSYIENAITNGLLSLVMSIANTDPETIIDCVETILDNVEARAVSRVPESDHKDVLLSRFDLPKTGRA